MRCDDEELFHDDPRDIVISVFIHLSVVWFRLLSDSMKVNEQTKNADFSP